ncbi:MAG TPA: hypothetical protein VMS64_01045 [Candidatus Methylomirabilis sp.]|nr:hypothetical protein [Candidatus Methylomirabilis sp.]
MSKGRARYSRLRLTLMAMLAFVALVGPRSAAEEADSREFRGACYCRTQRELMCSANLTARECDLRSKLALCDDWFWKERLACWNWGYGG